MALQGAIQKYEQFLEEFEVKYPKQTRELFGPLVEAMARNDKAEYSKLGAQLSSTQRQLFNQYKADLKTKSQLKSAAEVEQDEINSRLEELKSQKQAMLTQYAQQAAASFREVEVQVNTGTPSRVAVKNHF